MTWSGVIGQALMQTPSSSPKSLPVSTSTTLVVALAAAVSMLVMVACANGLRTIARCSIPGQGDVVGPARAAGDQPLVLLAAPVAADLERGSRCVLDGGHAGAPSLAPLCSAAYCTALTMLW